MADNAQEKPQRTAADKERSRQQSRAVSGKEAARTVGRNGRGQTQSRPPAKTGKDGGGQPESGQTKTNQSKASQSKAAQGKANQSKASQSPGRQGQAARPATGRSGGRSTPAGAGRPAAARRPQPGRSRAALLTWGAVAVVVVIVLIVVLVNVTSSSTKSTTVTPTAVPADILTDVTQIPTSVYNAVGTGSTAGVTAPKVQSGQPPLTVGGKPEFFYMGGEFCPYCAAERWAIIASLSRFGTFSGLQTMSSSSTDVYPSTETFTFAHATYTSQDVYARLVEHYGQDKPTGARTVLQPLTRQESALVTKYDVGTSPTSSGSIPFINVANKLIVSGASYTPQLLQGLTRAQIAGDLSDATNPVTKAIVGTSNYLSAGICSANNNQPASVCTSKGVQTASKALGLSS